MNDAFTLFTANAGASEQICVEQFVGIYVIKVANWAMAFEEISCDRVSWVFVTMGEDGVFSEAIANTGEGFEKLPVRFLDLKMDCIETFQTVSSCFVLATMEVLDY